MLTGTVQCINDASPRAGLLTPEAGIPGYGEPEQFLHTGSRGPFRKPGIFCVYRGTNHMGLAQARLSSAH